MTAPAYLERLAPGELARRAERARARLADCDLCARMCRVDRTATLKGVACRTGVLASVDGFGPHFGEEEPITGHTGSGTIFFSSCNLRCVYCQNWEISQAGRGAPAAAEDLAEMMLRLQALECHNINFVSPSHVVAQILEALVIAVDRGLRVPLVYNTGGYDSLEALELLEDVVDIYMPDMKYAADETARRYSRVRGYVKANRTAVREMYRQVGDLVTDAFGVAVRGLLVRHLVLPGGLAGTDEVLGFLAREVSPRTAVNVMDQYRPCYKAGRHPPLDRRASVEEVRAAQALANRLGLPAPEGNFPR